MKFPNVNHLSCQNLIASNKRNALAAITQRNILQLVTFCPCFKTFSSSKLLFCCKVVFIKIMMTIYLYTFVCATDAWIVQTKALQDFYCTSLLLSDDVLSFYNQEYHFWNYENDYQNKLISVNVNLPTKS